MYVIVFRSVQITSELSCIVIWNISYWIMLFLNKFVGLAIIYNNGRRYWIISMPKVKIARSIGLCSYKYFIGNKIIILTIKIINGTHNTFLYLLFLCFFKCLYSRVTHWETIKISLPHIYVYFPSDRPCKRK